MSNPSSGRYCAPYTCALSGSGPRARAWAAGAAVCGLAVARPRVVPGSFPPARACYSWPRRCFGLPQRFSWPRRGFPLPAIKKARQPIVIITLDPLSEHFRGRNALWLCAAQNFQAGGALQLHANSKSSPRGCFMTHFSADVVSCAQKLAATLCPCNVLLAACQFVLFAARRFLQFVT